MRNDTAWFLVDLAHGRAGALIAAAEAEHKRRWPSANLSAPQNNAGTQALIKVADFELSRRIGGAFGTIDGPVLDIFTPRNHARAVALLAGRDWSGLRSAEP